MPDELEERLRSHARSFDSLLSLIPAKLYYGEDVSDQWKRKKQTPEQKKAAKMAKLDPENWRSAKDIMDERAAAAKRKREEQEEDTIQSSVPGIELEKPKIAQDREQPKSKKRKVDTNVAHEAAHTDQSSQQQQQQQEQQQQKKTKRQKQTERKAVERQKQKAKQERQAARKAEQKLQAHDEKDDEWSDVHEEDEGELAERIELNELPSNLLADAEMVDAASTASYSSAVSQVMSPPAESASSSISSLPISESKKSQKSSKPLKDKGRPKEQRQQQPSGEMPPSIDPLSEPNTSISVTLSEAEKAAARDRLSTALSTFRTQRKAGTNPRSRQQLLDQRRAKEDERRQLKKEQRRLEREAAAQEADAEIERRFSPGGSGSLLGSPRSPPMSHNDNEADNSNNNFSFGRVAFADGSSVDPSSAASLLSSEKPRKQGPRDTQTALVAAKNKATRLAGLDPTKRKEIEEKDMWLNAKKRAHGERVRDDTSLLKKALKRQEGRKLKSEKEWNGRLEGVQKAQEMKQKKRTENLARRKDEKKHGGKKSGSSSASKSGKQTKVKRPGFEGSFRGRSGGSASGSGGNGNKKK